MALKASGIIGTLRSGSFGGKPRDMGGNVTVGNGSDMTIVIVLVALSIETDER